MELNRTISAELPAQSLGSLVARVLAGSWRATPPAPDLSAPELEQIIPLLLGSGASALGWRRIRHSGLGAAPAAVQLQHAYRMHALHAALHERDIAEVFPLLRAAGVEPLLIKGWGIARLYPESGLRPYGDIDLCLRPEQFPVAEAVLKSPAGQKYYVDLDHGFIKSDPYSLKQLFARSQLIKLGEVEVRLLGPEDHFRILCVHMLRHGAWRPLWLCDIAAALELRPVDFDWDRCLSASRRHADWIACAIGLAHQLLGAEVDETPVAERAKHLPRWLVPTVLKQWARPFFTAQPFMRIQAPMIEYLRHPAGLLQGIRHRWPPNPIGATIEVAGAFNELPRLPYQVGEILLRVARFSVQLPKKWRAQV